MLCLWLASRGFNLWISFTPVCSCMYSLVLVFVLSPFYISILYVLGDDTSIIRGSCMQTKHLFVLILIRNKGEAGTVNHV